MRSGTIPAAISALLLTASLAHAQGRPADLAVACRYSERGQAYVDDIRRIIRQNRLDATDDAYLKDMPVVLIVAAKGDSK